MEDYPGDQLRPSRGGEVRGTGVRSRSLAALGMRGEGVQRRRAGQAPPPTTSAGLFDWSRSAKTAKDPSLQDQRNERRHEVAATGLLVDGEVAMTLEEAMVKVWREALVEGAAEVELDGKKFAARETPRKRLREVDFEFEGEASRETVRDANDASRETIRGTKIVLRGLEQNPNTE